MAKKLKKEKFFDLNKYFPNGDTIEAEAEEITADAQESQISVDSQEDNDVPLITIKGDFIAGVADVLSYAHFGKSAAEKSDELWEAEEEEAEEITADAQESQIAVDSQEDNDDPLIINGDFVNLLAALLRPLSMFKKQTA